MGAIPALDKRGNSSTISERSVWDREVAGGNPAFPTYPISLAGRIVDSKSEEVGSNPALDKKAR